MTLDADAARRAIASRVAAPLGLDPLAAASGIVEIANAHMIGAMRLVSVQRGYDPRDFVLVAFGGAGPLHANALARELGIPTVLVPPSPGIASAIGMLATDIRHEFVATRRLRLDGLAPAALEALFADFVAEGEARLARDGVPLADRRMLRSADLRYHGQSFELPVTVPPGPLSAADVAAAARRVPRHARARLRLRGARRSGGAGQRAARRGGRDARSRAARRCPRADPPPRPR